MKSILRATLVLSSSSIVSILVGLISSKVWAVLLGSTGLGFMGLLQNLVGLGGLLAGTGVGVGLVRMGANALARDERDEVAALQRGAWLLFLAMSGASVLIMILFREQIGAWMLGGSEHAGYVLLMAVALVFTLASNVQTSTLNAHHRVRTLASSGYLQRSPAVRRVLALCTSGANRG